MRTIVLTLGALGGITLFGGGAAQAQGPCTFSTRDIPLPVNGVFNCTTVTVPSGATVTFRRNSANTPVTIVAIGDVTIAGTIDLSGQPGRDASAGTALEETAGVGGPGGGNGGNGANGILTTAGSVGLGPGGGGGGPIEGEYGRESGGGGGFGTPGRNSDRGGAGGPPYGTSGLLPLIGGSGGGGGGAPFGFTAGGGGGGGGAILVQTPGTITFTGTIRANGGPASRVLCCPQPGGGAGGGGGGSGGAVRLVANRITGTDGSISVAGGPNPGGFAGAPGGIGRIRLEANTREGLRINFPEGQVPSLGEPTTLPNLPTLRITTIAGLIVPPSPEGSFSRPDVVLPADTDTQRPIRVTLTASYVRLNTIVNVTVVGQSSFRSSAGSTPLAGTLESSTATVDVTIPRDQAAIIGATATFTLVAGIVGSPVFVEGADVERVRVSATVGGPSQVTYITRSGREIVMTASR